MNKLNSNKEKNNFTTYINWLKDKNFSPHTIIAYTQIVRRYKEEINNANIDKFFKGFLTKYEPKTLKLWLTALSSYAKFKKIKIHWEKITKLIPAVQQKFFTTISEQELVLMKNVRNEVNDWSYERNNLILDFFFYTGVRISELVNIKHRDYQDRAVRIMGKGNKVRYIFLPEWLTEYFNPYSSDYFFTSRDGEKISIPHVRRIITQRAIQAGIKKNVSPHTFRRSFATLLNNRGTNLTTIQKLLGHARLETTANYIHNDYNALYEDYSKLWKNNPTLNTYE